MAGRTLLSTYIDLTCSTDVLPGCILFIAGTNLLNLFCCRTSRIGLPEPTHSNDEVHVLHCRSSRIAFLGSTYPVAGSHSFLLPE